MNRVSHFLLVCILIFAFVIRVWDLNNNPPELHHDELVGYLGARTIIETGKDLDGRLLPYFYGRTERFTPIYGYTAYLSTKFFGVSPFSIRFPAVLYGIGAIAVLYILTYELTKNNATSLLASLFLAILPWHIHFSRVGWGPAALPLFLLAGTYLLLSGIRRDMPVKQALGALVLGTSLYTYNTALGYAPILFTTIICINFSYYQRHKKFLFSTCLLFLLAWIPFMITYIADPQGFDRARRISTFATGISTTTITTFLTNYYKHFGIEFLFTKGDPNLRHSGIHGVIYWWMLPFLLIGLWKGMTILPNRMYFLLISVWLLAMPIGAAVTNDGVPHAARSLAGIVAFPMLASLGVYWAYRRLNSTQFLQRISLVALGLFVILSLYRFLFLYFTIYPSVSAGYWDYGQSQAFAAVHELEKDYDQVCLGNVDYWSSIQLINYYLPHSKLQIFETIDDPRCLEAHTIIVYPGRMPIAIGKSRKTIFTSNGTVLYTVYTIDN